MKSKKIYSKMLKSDLIKELKARDLQISSLQNDHITVHELNKENVSLREEIKKLTTISNITFVVYIIVVVIILLWER